MTIREFGPLSAPYVLIEPVGDHDPDGIEAEYNKIRQRADVTLTWNPGNHFAEPDIRTARAFAEVLRRLAGT